MGLCRAKEGEEAWSLSALEIAAVELASTIFKTACDCESLHCLCLHPFADKKVKNILAEFVTEAA